MASRPGLLTDWPWKSLGNFKYGLLAPFVAHSIYSFVTKEPGERNYFNFLIFPFVLVRMLQSQLWISYSRYRTAKNRIVEKNIEFEQVDRERNWDDNMLFVGLMYYVISLLDPETAKFPVWNTKGFIMTFLLHIGPVEFIYYWFHRALHHHYLYTRYHSHHHSSIATEAITAIVHPFAEHIAYLTLFGTPILVIARLTGTSSLVCVFGYIILFDSINNLGHCNFEFIPSWLFTAFPPLKYLIYTPSFHSLHHTQFRTNLSLFMPIYDYIYGTFDNSSDVLYEKSLQKKEDTPDVVHLTHFTTVDSIYHLRLGFASVASKPQNSKWYLRLMAPFTWLSVVMTSFLGETVISERNKFKDLKLQSWAIPRFNFQYFAKWQQKTIRDLIENAILEADAKGVRVLSLGIFNQDKELNRNGLSYIEKHPKLNVKIVDGSSLAIAILLNNIPQGTKEVLLRGKFTKIVYPLVAIMCHKGIKVVTVNEDEYLMLKDNMKDHDNLVLSKSYDQKVWLVGEGLTDEDQSKAPKGTIFIPFSALPPKKTRNNCLYHYTPAMAIPASVENVDSCENWLPRRVMSAPRIAGMLHALEGWTEHECGKKFMDIETVWKAALKHGFTPLTTPY